MRARDVTHASILGGSMDNNMLQHKPASPDSEVDSAGLAQKELTPPLMHPRTIRAPYFSST